MNKAFIDGKIYDVMDAKDFGYVPYCGDSLALNMGNFILPIRDGKITVNSKPGIYPNGIFFQYIYPRNEIEALEYSTIHLAYFVDAGTFKEVLEAKEKLERDEYKHLVSSDKKFAPPIDEINDSPLIIALKRAVTEKQCDINRYAEKFGADFNNDRRKFNGKDITAAKYKSISNNMDIRTTLIVEDMNPDVANPMGNRLVVTWVGDGKNDKAYEQFYRESISGSPDLNGYVEDINPNEDLDEDEDDLAGIDICYF